MSEADRLRWNQRWADRHAAHDLDSTPLPRLLHHQPLLASLPLVRPARGTAADSPRAKGGAMGRQGRAGLERKARSRVAPTRPTNRSLLPRALDLACGAGRHALYLATLGYDVDAWDVSDTAIDLLTHAAQDRGLQHLIHPQRVDLDSATLPPATYDLILDAYFLDRRLLPSMTAALKPGGLLFMETLLSTPNHPGRPDFYLQPAELPTLFPTLVPLFYEETPAESCATLLARRP